MSKQILITGGAGFVGSHLADALLAAGHSVRVLDDLAPQVHPAGPPDYLSSDVELITGDVRDPNRLKEVLAGVNVVFHFAATVGVGQSMYEISRYMSINTQGTAELLQAILDSKAHVQKIIVASSMSIYGEGRYICSKCGRASAPPVRTIAQLKRGDWDLHCDVCKGVLKPRPTAEDKPSEINSMYALSKRDQEELCLIYGRTYGLPVTALRFFNIYGTRQALSNPYTGVAAIFASRLMNGKSPIIFEDGLQLRDFVNVRDIVQANLLAMETSGADGTAVNIGSGEPVSVREVALQIASLLGVQMPLQITGAYRAGDIRHCHADISKASDTLGYVPSVSFRQGMTELVEWLESQQAHDHTEEALKDLAARGLVA